MKPPYSDSIQTMHTPPKKSPIIICLFYHQKS